MTHVLADAVLGGLDSEAKVTTSSDEGRGLGKSRRSERAQREAEGVGWAGVSGQRHSARCLRGRFGNLIFKDLREL